MIRAEITRRRYDLNYKFSLVHMGLSSQFRCRQGLVWWYETSRWGSYEGNGRISRIFCWNWRFYGRYWPECCRLWLTLCNGLIKKLMSRKWPGERTWIWKSGFINMLLEGIHSIYGFDIDMVWTIPLYIRFGKFSCPIFIINASISGFNLPWFKNLFIPVLMTWPIMMILLELINWFTK